MPLFTDPYTPDADRYECRDCSERQSPEDRVDECSICGGDVHNVAVLRE